MTSGAQVQPEETFISLESRPGGYAATCVNVPHQRELEVRERIKKFLEG